MGIPFSSATSSTVSDEKPFNVGDVVRLKGQPYAPLMTLSEWMLPVGQWACVWLSLDSQVRIGCVPPSVIEVVKLKNSESQISSSTTLWQQARMASPPFEKYTVEELANALSVGPVTEAGK